MKSARALVALLGLVLLGVDSLRSAPPPFYGGPYGGPGFGFPGRHWGGGFGPGGPGPFPGGAGIGVTVYGPAPGGPPPSALTPLPPSLDDIKEEDHPDKIIIRPRKNRTPKDPELPEEKPLPGEPAGNFRPIRPEDRARAQPDQPGRPEMPEPKKPEPPKPEPKKPEVPPPPAQELPPKPAPKPEVGGDRSLAMGKLAFGQEEYARAEYRFKVVVGQDPKNARAYFLLAQCQFAQGKYREAVATIHAGLKLKPDWPVNAWRVKELYGANPALFTEHMEQLQQALARRPADPVLLFLYAYQLWFDGREAEARPLFRRAAPLVTEPRFIELFLQAREGGQVVLR